MADLLFGSSERGGLASRKSSLLGSEGNPVSPGSTRQELPSQYSHGAALLGAHEPLRVGRELSGADGSWTVARSAHFGNGTHRALAWGLRGISGHEVWAILVWDGFAGSYRISGMPVNRDHAEALYEERPCPHCGLEQYIYQAGCYNLWPWEAPIRDLRPDVMDVIRANREAAL